MVSWNRWASWVTTPMVAVNEAEVGVADVEAVDADGPRAYVVEAGEQLADGGLPGAGRADQGHQLTRLGREGDVEEDLLGDGGVQDRHRLQGGQRDLLRGRVAEVDVVELDPGRPGRYRTGVGLVLDHGRQVEDLEDPVERDQGGHDVDLNVGQRGEWTVEAGQVGGQGHHRPQLQRAVDHLDAAPSVDHGGGQGRRQREGGDEEPGVHGLGDADVPHPPGLLLELVPLLVGATEQLDQQGPGDVEPLGHGVVHLGVEPVGLPGDRSTAVAPPAWPAGRRSAG